MLVISTVFLVNIVNACLEIESVKAYVNDKKESLGSIDAQPDSELELKVKVENTCSDDTKLDLDDVRVEVTIEGIDDGDDLEEESDEFGLDTERSKEVTIKFDIPLEVDDDSFKLVILALGDQANDSSINYNDTEEGSVDIEKESHEVIFTRAAISSEKLKCARTTSVDVGIVNIGKDEEDVALKIDNSDLGISVRDSDITLNEDPFDSDSKYSNSYTITVPEDAKAGTYPIKITADYSSETKTETLDLTVEDCPQAAEEPEEVETVITPPTTTTPSTGIMVQPPTTSTEEKPLTNWLVIGIIAAEVLVILIGGIFVIRWAIKKR